MSMGKIQNVIPALDKKHFFFNSLLLIPTNTSEYIPNVLETLQVNQRTRHHQLYSKSAVRLFTKLVSK